MDLLTRHPDEVVGYLVRKNIASTYSRALLIS